MSILDQTNLLKIRASSQLDKTRQSALGQFFTAAPVSLYMASLFKDISGDVRLLDPGCGPGSLTAAFVDETIKRGRTQSLDIQAFDIDGNIEAYITETLRLCKEKATSHDIEIASQFRLEDFILTPGHSFGLFSKEHSYTHVIMNPPYRKISSLSPQRKALRSMNIEAVNLYSGFVELAIQKLLPGGELVAIIPRSFCNGPYYRSFRETLLEKTSIHHIHTFDSRSNVFVDDCVLQENIIIHLIKGEAQRKIVISSSPNADFYFDRCFSRTLRGLDCIQNSEVEKIPS